MNHEYQPENVWKITVTCPILDSWIRLGTVNGSLYKLKSALLDIVSPYGGTVELTDQPKLDHETYVSRDVFSFIAQCRCGFLARPFNSEKDAQEASDGHLERMRNWPDPWKS